MRGNQRQAESGSRCFSRRDHAFNVPFEKPMDYLGHHFEHDEKATQEAQKDADAFMDTHMK
jgi:dienelactone hydrolase